MIGLLVLLLVNVIITVFINRSVRNLFEKHMETQLEAEG